MASLTELQAVKDRLGGLVRLDYAAYDLPTAHRLLGQHVRQQLQSILKHKLDVWESARIQKLLNQSQVCLAALAKKCSDERLDMRLRVAISEYLECLAAWSDGAGLHYFDHSALKAYKPLGALDLAMFMQNDCTGCQTGLYRAKDGSVVLWHTEEDVEDEPGSGFDSLRIAAFNASDRDHAVVMNAFIYPDLLPGPAFGWRSDGYAQGVDKLHIRDFPELSRGTLANVVTWLTLRLGAALEAREIIASLQPFYDGYALNTVHLERDEVLAQKHEFAGDRNISSHLDAVPNSYLFQVNIFSDREHPWVPELEDLRPDWCRLYEKRVERTVQALQNRNGKPGEHGEMEFFFNMMTDQAGDSWAYANEDVKAYFLHKQSLNGAETWLGHGPPIPDDAFTVIKS
jgi:hypothetical protein